MRELATREYTPTLAFTGAVLFFAVFLVNALLRDPVAAAGVHLLFVPVLVLLVMQVDAPPWGRLAGYAWAALALLADLLTLGAAAADGNIFAGLTLASLAMIPGAVWVLGASLADDGAGRALGVAAALGLLLSAGLGLTDRFLLVGQWGLGDILQQGTLLVTIAWFAVLGRDLLAGRRHWGGHVSLR